MTAQSKGTGMYNVVIIGAGSAGLVTAAATAGLGGRVALIERNKMGGDCLNFGCVPSKALISSAREQGGELRGVLFYHGYNSESSEVGGSSASSLDVINIGLCPHST